MANLRTPLFFGEWIQPGSESIRPKLQRLHETFVSQVLQHNAAQNSVVELDEEHNSTEQSLEEDDVQALDDDMEIELEDDDDIDMGSG